MQLECVIANEQRWAGTVKVSNCFRVFFYESLLSFLYSGRFGSALFLLRWEFSLINIVCIVFSNTVHWIGCTSGK